MNDADSCRCDDMAARILRFCEAHDVKIVAAESLTGGLLADAFVRVPGASRVFLGSAVTYDIRAKASILGSTAVCWNAKGPCIPKWPDRWRRRSPGCTGSPNTLTVSSDCRPPAWRGPDRMETSPRDWCMWECGFQPP